MAPGRGTVPGDRDDRPGGPRQPVRHPGARSVDGRRPVVADDLGRSHRGSRRPLRHRRQQGDRHRHGRLDPSGARLGRRRPRSRRGRADGAGGHRRRALGGHHPPGRRRARRPAGHLHAGHRRGPHRVGLRPPPPGRPGQPPTRRHLDGDAHRHDRRLRHPHGLGRRRRAVRRSRRARPAHRRPLHDHHRRRRPRHGHPHRRHRAGHHHDHRPGGGRRRRWRHRDAYRPRPGRASTSSTRST